jgi:hypothetical protein
MKEDYFKKSMETLDRIEKRLNEQKYTYSVLLWFIILIGFGIYYADRL